MGSKDTRLDELKAGGAITVRMNKRKGLFVDAAATSAERDGLLTYCGNKVRFTGHPSSPWHNHLKCAETTIAFDIAVVSSL